MNVVVATLDDVPALRRIMDRAIAELQQPFLSPAQLTASKELMGLDTQLIIDGTYFKVIDGDTPVGCGGWSRRATLFGGDHTTGRSNTLLDPSSEPARVRAMYTDPDHARRGIGRLILQACEQAARAEKFSRVELAATLAGVPLYEACGFVAIEHRMEPTSTVAVPLVRMQKPL
ncbi:MAG: GNAT family N-acetyltransferase [Kofleriaceae bacterium]